MCVCRVVFLNIYLFTYLLYYNNFTHTGNSVASNGEVLGVGVKTSTADDHGQHYSNHDDSTVTVAPHSCFCIRR